jgi:hypothetical protein
MFVLEVARAFNRARIPHAFVGGCAVALHGAVRGTVDVDLVVEHSEAAFLRAERVLNSLGLESRLPLRAAEVYRFREEYIRNRQLSAWTFVNPAKPSEIVDLILTHDASVMKIKKIRIQGHIVRLASIEDLIRMKKESGRPQDLEDVKALRSLQ